MSSKPKIPKRLSQLEIWKGIRKDPTPPGRIHQPRDRALDAEAAADEIDAELLDEEGEEIRCVFCGELRFASDFEDGLRCRYCVENDAATDWEDEGGQ